MKESEKLQKIRDSLLLKPATTRRQRIEKDAQLANVDRLIETHRKRESLAA